MQVQYFKCIDLFKDKLCKTFVWKFSNNAQYWFLRLTWSVYTAMYVAMLKTPHPIDE